jgi:hypothetical protein
VFWWYWSLRRRLLSLVVLLVPVLVFFGFRLLGGSEEAPEASGPVVSTPVSSGTKGTEGAAPSEGSGASAVSVDVLQIRSDASRAASSRFPEAFGAFSEGVSVVDNLVLPGIAADEYSFYAVFLAIDGPPPGAASSASPSSTVPVTTTVPGPVLGPDATPEEKVRGVLLGHFSGLGAIVREIETVDGVELSIAGLEKNRGYRALLQFAEVSGKVVVYGKVSEVAPNEIADMLEAEQTGPVTPEPAPGEDEGTTDSSTPVTVAPETTVP